MSYPEPIPSMSTPLQSTTNMNDNKRTRRHTITRPDSALALLNNDEEEDIDEEEQLKSFDRISDILSNLIQEANQAVNGIEKERVQLLKSNSMLKSKIPRPRKKHTRNISTCSNISNSSTLVSSSRSSSPILIKKQQQLINLKRSVIKANTKLVVKDPIMESYKRLDSSMALVESLSRDLATSSPTSSSNSGLDSKLTILLLIPLLHIPHSLITIMFDFFMNNNNNNVFQFKSTTTSANPSSFTSMIFWAIMFTVANLMVDKAILPNDLMQKVRRMSLPGTFKLQSSPKKLSPQKKKPTNNSAVPMKRTWIPSTVQKQYQFQLGEETIPPHQVRRNSI